MHGVEVPDAVEPIVAWRTWMVVKGGDKIRLRSTPMYRTLWPTRYELEASCVFSPSGVAPAEDCHCGIHGAKNYRQLRPYVVGDYDQVRPGDIWRALGKVNLWGKTIIGTQGVRAQYAYPKSIVLPARAAGFADDQMTDSQREAVADALRDAYGIPVVVELRPLVRRILNR